MKNLLLHNFYGKIASLIVAFAIWYLIHDNVSRPIEKYNPDRYPVPGTAPAPIEGSPIEPANPVSPILDVPVPGTTGMMTPSFREEMMVEVVERRLTRLDWIETNDHFSGWVSVYPGVELRG